MYEAIMLSLCQATVYKVDGATPKLKNPWFKDLNATMKISSMAEHHGDPILNGVLSAAQVTWSRNRGWLEKRGHWFQIWSRSNLLIIIRPTKRHSVQKINDSTVVPSSGVRTTVILVLHITEINKWRPGVTSSDMFIMSLKNQSVSM
jgi:hypothetical protein